MQTQQPACACILMCSHGSGFNGVGAVGEGVCAVKVVVMGSNGRGWQVCANRRVTSRWAQTGTAHGWRECAAFAWHAHCTATGWAGVGERAGQANEQVGVCVHWMQWVLHVTLVGHGTNGAIACLMWQWWWWVDQRWVQLAGLSHVTMMARWVQADANYDWA